MGPEKRLGSLERWLLQQRTGLPCPALTWQLTASPTRYAQLTAPPDPTSSSDMHMFVRTGGMTYVNTRKINFKNVNGEKNKKKMLMG